MKFTVLLFHLLQNAKTWYLDATFKAVKNPFQELWSIHAFIQQNDALKQIPLVFVLCRHMKDDYTGVINYQQRLLINSSVQCVVMDSEADVWGAFRSVLPGVLVRGCSFHKFLRVLMCLPFLPFQHTPSVFKEFMDLLELHHPQALHQLLQYIEETWTDGSVWTPESWSVFGQSVKTSNDVEGWHCHLIHLCARENVNIHVLIEVLHKE